MSKGAFSCMRCHSLVRHIADQVSVRLQFKVLKSLKHGHATDLKNVTLGHVCRNCALELHREFQGKSYTDVNQSSLFEL